MASYPTRMLTMVAVPVLFMFTNSTFMAEEVKTAANCNASLKGFWREKDAIEAIRLFKRLQEAVEKDARNLVADMVSYPLRVSGEYRIHNRTAFLRNYDKIFDAKVRTAIAKQIPECINGNWRGFFTELGEVWVEGLNNGPMSVIAVNSESWPKIPARKKTTSEH